MRRELVAALTFAFALAFVGSIREAAAAEPIGDDGSEGPTDLPRLILDSGRVPAAAAEPDAYRAFVHGEYQIRYQAERSFLLDATPTARSAQPGLAEQSLGQNQFVSHWLRVTPELQLLDKLEVVGQADLSGLVVGSKARGVSADETPRDSYNGFSNVQPRWLYAQYKLPSMLIRVGQQPNHWGMGIFANDGNHPLLFGDYRYGQISERISFATTPGGSGLASNLHVAIAADLVFRDNEARLTRGDHAVQGVVAAYWERAQNELGLFTTVRHQDHDRTSSSDLFDYQDQTDRLALDLHGKFASTIPGDDDTYFFGELEATYLLGSTTAGRTAAEAAQGDRAAIRAYGGAASFGVVHRSWSSGFSKDESPEYAGAPFGDIVAQLEVGYASGDANPNDGTDKRFTFDPNHRIGLLMFDEVLRFQTARAATALADPLLANGSRPPSGIDQLPSDGGVFGAQYVNPTVVVRPRHWLDLKGGVVVAQSTSEVVDPYRSLVSGSAVNYRGGDPKKKDLGVELDAGTEARFPLSYGLVAQAGAQAGILFPGSALDDANGVRMPTQWIAIGRLGLQF